MIIYYTKHAEDKFFLLQEHGRQILKEDINNIIKLPDFIDRRKEHIFACGKVAPNDDMWEVIYTEEGNMAKVLTFYPIKKKKNNENSV